MTMFGKSSDNYEVQMQKKKKIIFGAVSDSWQMHANYTR